MERILLSLCLTSVVLSGVVSCSGALDIVQDDKLTFSNMWKTSAQVESSTNTIYDDIRLNFIQDDITMLHWGELRVGDRKSVV